MDINQAFKFTSKMIFGGEIGELGAYKDYLAEAVIGKKGKSQFSGQDIFLTSDKYAPGARFFDYNKEHGKMAAVLSRPIDAGRIKDIDSLLEAVGEKLVYSGNKVLGNSHFVENSDNVFDSNYVYSSSIVFESKYVAYSYICRESEYAFGLTSSGVCSTVIRCFYNNTLKRSFECCYGIKSSDCTFCYNIINCSDCLFTFNVRSKRNMIGNIQLEKGKYAELKAKLAAELRGELEKGKKLDFSIVDMVRA
ncbi:Uncharacterised protein [uncultured archaeon]|nr:Uncharacterised protein [uncultured archaeon]